MTLLNLPPELRYQILTEALNISGSTYDIQPCTTTEQCCKSRHVQPSHVSLLLTCRTLYHDVTVLTSRLQHRYIFCSTICARKALQRTKVERLQIRTTGLWTLQTEVLSGIGRLKAPEGLCWKMGPTEFVNGRYVLNFQLGVKEKGGEEYRGVCAVQ